MMYCYFAWIVKGCILSEKLTNLRMTALPKIRSACEIDFSFVLSNNC